MNRQALKDQRLALTPHFKAESATAVAQRVLHQSFFQEAEHLAFYWPVNGELDPRPLMKAAQALNKRVYLPVLDPHKAKHLAFMPFEPDTALVNNRFGIPEPLIDQAKIFEPEKLDLVFAPLLAFDPQGHRIGMGAGFYDRTFAFLNQKPRPAKPLLCGLGYDFQEVALITPEPWDVRLDLVITPLSIKP